MALVGVVSAESVGYNEFTDSQKQNIVHHTENTVTAKSDNTPWHTPSTGTSFTLTFDITNISMTSGDILSIAGNNTQQGWDDGLLQIRLDGDKVVLLNTPGGNNSTKYFDGSTAGNPTVSSYTMDLGLAATESTTGYTTITLVSDAANQVFTAYNNGTKVGHWTNWNTDTGITGIQFGARFGGGLSIDGTFDYNNVVIWNKALSADEVAAFVIPEPTTAVLSLLALAGLSIRRRRR